MSITFLHINDLAPHKALMDVLMASAYTPFTPYGYMYLYYRPYQPSSPHKDYSPSGVSIPSGYNSGKVQAMKDHPESQPLYDGEIQVELKSLQRIP